MITKYLTDDIELSTAPEDLHAYSFDSSIVSPVLPVAVAWPRSTMQTQKLIEYAREHNYSVVPRGAGTGMAGGSVPADNRSLVISFEKMYKIIDINTKNFTTVVEPGIVNASLQQELRLFNLFYPPDPASMDMCTIGGNVATNAGGPRAFKYGVTRDYVLSVDAVLADGSVITAGGKTTKRTVGYDLKSLFIGSEGTLCLFTKIMLRLRALPEDSISLLVMFKDVISAANAVNLIVSNAIVPATMEFLDSLTISAIEAYAPVGLPEGISAVLIIELDGLGSQIRSDANKIADICSKLNAETVIAEDYYSRERLWQARRAISPALYHLSPKKINEDIVVPRSKIADFLSAVQKLMQDTGIKIACFGHAGDGNIHVNILTAEHEQTAVNELIREIFKITISLGGAISGEHGIGTAKAPFLDMQICNKQLSLFKGIKSLFDPQGILNPHKIMQLP